MRRVILMVLGVIAGVTAGCKPKEITSFERKQGANFAAEANFAISVRDYARAEGLLLQATAVCPDMPEYWLGLGTARRRLENRAGAKGAYEEALKASQARYKRDPKNPQPILQQIYLLALLGRVDDARSTLEKARKNHPDSRDLRAFAENNQMDRMLADPSFKELTP